VLRALRGSDIQLLFDGRQTIDHALTPIFVLLFLLFTRLLPPHLLITYPLEIFHMSKTESKEQEPSASKSTLAILYSKGGLGDVGRHAILAALERDDVGAIKVFTQHPELIQEYDQKKNWNCGCPEKHVLTKEQLEKIEIITVGEHWKVKDLSPHFECVTAVVSCLGNRQMFIGDRVAGDGTKVLVACMGAKNVKRVVGMTSVCLGDDLPGIEWHFAGKIMTTLFRTVSRREAVDLRRAEVAYQDSDLDYLLIRPMGLGEDVKPKNEWFIQKEKFKDTLGINMAKLDCARYMVEEALNPTRSRTAVVIGADPEKDA
jgi:hypothetical protein